MPKVVDMLVNNAKSAGVIRIVVCGHEYHYGENLRKAFLVNLPEGRLIIMLISLLLMIFYSFISDFQATVSR